MEFRMTVEELLEMADWVADQVTSMPTTPKSDIQVVIRKDIMIYAKDGTFISQRSRRYVGEEPYKP